MRKESGLDRADPEVRGMKLGRYPFAAGIKHYLERRYGVIAESTYKEEDRKLRYIAKVFRDLKDEGRIRTTDPRHIRRKELQEFLAWMKRDDLDPTTQAKYLQYLKNYLKFFRNHVFEEMKADGVRFPKATTKPIRVIGRGDLDRIFETVERMGGWHGSVATGMIALYFATGARPKELRLAHFEDLDLEKGWLFIRHPKGEGSWAGGSQVAIIRPDVMRYVRIYLREREARIQARGLKEATYLFPNLYRGSDTFYSANSFNVIKRKVEDLSGVDFKLKDFRSTLASVTVMNDLSRLPAVSAQLRHTKLETTQKFYARIEQGVAGKQLEDVWKESPVRSAKKPFIENKFDYTGYA